MDDFKLIFAYTRAQAIEDGVLIDVTTQASEVGFKLHTVVTDNLYHQYILPPDGLEGEGQTVEGRLHDVLWMVLVAARAAMDGHQVETDVMFLMAPGRMETVRIIAVVGPGDSAQPVLTVMLPGDD